jgi:hypothetical protein
MDDRTYKLEDFEPYIGKMFKTSVTRSGYIGGYTYNSVFKIISVKLPEIIVQFNENGRLVEDHLLDYQLDTILSRETTEEISEDEWIINKVT